MEEELRFAVEIWTANDSLNRVIARSSSIVVARAALDCAIEEYPGARITLSHGGRLIDSTEKREREGKRLRGEC